MADRLEPRRLLVTLQPGELFTYGTFDYEDIPDSPDDFVTAQVRFESDDPDTEVELFGATLDGRLAQPSGVISGSSDPSRNGPINGGVGGTIGIVPLTGDEVGFIDEDGATQQLNRTDLVQSQFIPSNPLIPGLFAAPQDLIAFNAIASNSDGRTFGVQLVDRPQPDPPGGDIREIQIYEVNLDGSDVTRNVAGGGSVADQTNAGDAVLVGEVIDDVIAAFATADALASTAESFIIPGADNAEQRANINQIVGASFSPDDPDTLYLGLDVTLPRADGFPAAPDLAEVSVFTIVAINLDLGTDPAQLAAGTVAEVIGSDFFSDEQRLDNQTIATIDTFVAVGDEDADVDVVLHGTFSRRVNEGTGSQAIESVSGATFVSNVALEDSVQLGNVSALTLLGEVVVPQRLGLRPGAEFGGLYGITEPGDETQLFQITDNEGGGLPSVEGINGPGVIAVESVGGLQRSDADGDALGEDLQSITWVPNITNPFTGGQGVFISFDVAQDQFVFVDQRPRGVGGSLSIYTIVVTNGDPETTTLNFTALDDDGPTGFLGDPGPLVPNGDEPFGLPDGSGELYLGMKFLNDDGILIPTPSLDPNNSTEGTPAYSGILTDIDGEQRVLPGLQAIGSGIDQFVFGGAVTGQVRIEGSIGEFYAGGLLTGDSFNLGLFVPDNFAVFGDVEKIVSATSIGDTQLDTAIVGSPEGSDEPGYVSDLDFAIGGRVGLIKAGGSIVGSFEVRNDREPEGGFLAPTLFQGRSGLHRELEQQVEDADDARGLFILNEPVVEAFNNDTFATFESIGGTQAGDIAVSGELNSAEDGTPGDFVDYYGLGLMAGQTITVTPPGLGLALGIFDPDGRLVATTYEDNGATSFLVNELPFEFTAETAGTYRIAIGFFGNPEFLDGATSEFTITFGLLPYTFEIANAGDLGIGGLQAINRVLANVPSVPLDAAFDFPTTFNADGLIGDESIRLLQGDIGTVSAFNESILGNGAVVTELGHIRSLTGSNHGISSPNANVVNGVDGLAARAGYSIGRIEATGVSGGIYPGDVFINRGFLINGRADPAFVGAGDDIQIVTAARDIDSEFVVGRGIGSLVAGRSFGLGSSAIFTNVDDINDDGFVDLLSVGDSVGAVGALILSGPAIDLGTNGNFRYMDIPENGRAIRDPFFGNAIDGGFQILDQGEIFSFTDDSGTGVTIFPAEGIFNENFNAITDDPDDQIINEGTLEVITYPVRSGGSILVSLRSDQSVRIETQDRVARSTAEFGNIYLTGDGRPVVRRLLDTGFGFDASFIETELTLDTPVFSQLDPFGLNDPFEDLDLELDGRNIDVFNLSNSTGPGRFSTIRNDSAGEILNVVGTSIGSIEAERIGVAETAGFAELRSARLRTDVNGYPFQDESYVISVEGSIASIRGDAVGNIFAGIELGIGAIEAPDGFIVPTDPIGPAGDGIGGLRGSIIDRSEVQVGGGIGGIGQLAIGEVRGVIGSVTADAMGGDRTERNAFGIGRDREFRFEGIAGPIVAATPDTDTVEGQIDFVDIGEGIADEGNGNSSRAGLYAEAFITEVVGESGANIYGDVVANEIGRVILSGGSIIGGDIQQNRYRADVNVASPQFDTSREFQFLSTFTNTLFETADIEARVFYEIDSVQLNGGGMINATVDGTDIDTVRVSDGYGIFLSSITGLEEATVNSVSADGLGMRNVLVDSGLNLNTLAATGSDDVIDITAFNPSVLRSSDPDLEFEPVTGQRLSIINDLRFALGLERDVDARLRITDGGVIENVVATGARNLDGYSGGETRSNGASNPFFGDGRFVDDTSLLGAGDPLGGSFGNRVSFGRTIEDISIDTAFGFAAVAGAIDDVDAAENLDNTSLRTSGVLGDVNVGDTVTESTVIRAEGPQGVIGSVEAGTLLGTVRADVRIDDIVVNGDLGAPSDDPVTTGDSSLANIRSGGASRPNSNIGRLFVGGDVLTGAFIRATDQIGELVVVGDVLSGARIEADEIDSLEIGGSNFGTIIRS
ncbi:MAG: hypothetical protein AAF561_05070 [Planctomycetota bacterium]